MVEVHQQPASATNARKALLQSAQNLSFVRLVRFFELCTNKIIFCCFFLYELMTKPFPQKTTYIMTHSRPSLFAFYNLYIMLL